MSPNFVDADTLIQWGLVGFGILIGLYAAALHALRRAGVLIHDDDDARLP